MSSDKPISSAANSARLKVNPEDDFLDDSGRAETIPVEREYVSLNSSRLRANPEDVFLDDGGQIEYQQTTAATAKKISIKIPSVIQPQHMTFLTTCRASNTAHRVRNNRYQYVPVLESGLASKLKFTPRQMSDRTAAGSQA